ncbi:MAG: GIY-YIG nuclease family protein [Candidatus Zapsychrus exili]|nr:GIY-YIG nuclease family protein [Candidatus Zapsychrus exili]
MWYVYIIETEKNTPYTGITKDIERRMLEHKNSVGAKFTRAFGFKELLYKEEHPDRPSTLKREAEIKRLTSEEKRNIINLK